MRWENVKDRDGHCLEPRGPFWGVGWEGVKEEEVEGTQEWLWRWKRELIESLFSPFPTEKWCTQGE